MTRAGGKKAALAAILLAIALGFGGALTNLQLTEARADAALSASAALNAAPGASLAGPNASAANAATGIGLSAPNASPALTAAIPGGAAPGAGEGGVEASGRVAPGPAQPNPLSGAAQSTVDYDDDDDGLIDVTTLAQLNAIRQDLNGNGDATHADYVAAFPNRITAAGTRMGCPSGTCTGYELRADLDFDTDGDGDVDSNDSPSYANWDPIGSASSAYTAEFKGNNNTISNLTITSLTKARIGLFSNLSSSGTISGVGMRDANIAITSLPNSSRVGALVGHNEGTVRSSYSTGTVSGTTTGGSSDIGGLVGIVVQGGKVEASWSSADVTVSGPSLSVGGLVGQLGFQNNHGHVTACYATGDVSATGTTARSGGLVGWTLTSGSRVTASYSTGAVTASGTNSAANGLTGSGSTLSIVTSDSYWDTTTSSIADDADSDSPEGDTSANLKAPTGYTGIYANWNVNVDGSAGNDDPWDFGTSSHYPRLKFDDMDLAAQLRDYDLDDDGLAEIYNLDQLNALRWDIDGTGAHNSGTSAANQKKYKTAFFNADESLGCPDTADADSDPGPCAGYELMNDLDFDTDGSGVVDSSDSPSFTNWTPIGEFVSGATNSGAYTGDFDGNNNTISNLTLTNSDETSAGLFGRADGTITGVGLPDVNITQSLSGGTSPVSTLLGGLVGIVRGTVRSSWSTGEIASTSTSTNFRPSAGGLVGNINGGTVAASWSSVNVSATGAQARAGGLVGQVGFSTNGGAVIASYASGTVTASGTQSQAGGLAGGLNGNALDTITASYASNRVAGATVGALFGGSVANAVITSSYWDVSRSGIEDDANSDAPEGKTSSDLTTPTAYGTQSTDIYMGWNVNVDGSAGADDPWDFGAANQYPRLKFDGMDLSAQNIAPVVDYDADDDNLIDIKTLAQLNAVRWDLNGDGNPVSANAADYAAAFPNRDISASGRMGCVDASDPADNTADCGGYELMANLNFDTDDDGDVDANDSPSFPNWTPIGEYVSGAPNSGAYTAEFKGNNRTISNLTVTSGATQLYLGLFGIVETGTITGVGLPNVNITHAKSVSAIGYTGALVGLTGRTTIQSSWATGSVSLTSSASHGVGGVVGELRDGTVAASWADVDVSVNSSGATGYAGGLAGSLSASSIGDARVIASYAIGSVSNASTGATAVSGGLVGSAESSSNNWIIAASYAAGPVSSANGTAGGLLGRIVSGSSGSATAAYWDTDLTGIADDNDNNAPEGRTARQLQQPRPYSGIYRDWNVDIDNADTDNDLTTGRDDPWAFGAAMQYPMLKYGGMSLPAQGGLAMGAPNVDTNGETPTVGRMARVCLTTGPVLRAPRPGNPSLPARWVWQRSADLLTWTDITEDGGGTYEYTPVAADVNNYLRACVAIRSSDARSRGESEMCTRPFPAAQGN